MDTVKRSTDPLSCPRCGAKMNRHAEKIVHRDPDSPDFDGVVEEFHTCPGCRYVLERRSP